VRHVRDQGKPALSPSSRRACAGALPLTVTVAAVLLTLPQALEIRTQ